MFSLFAQIDSLNAENAAVTSDFWTWVLLFSFFGIGFVYYGLIWMILLKLSGIKNILLQGKFYYSIFSIALLTIISDFLFLFIFGKFGIILAAAAMFVINLVVIKFTWKLNNKKILIFSAIVTLASAPWFLFVMK